MADINRLLACYPPGSSAEPEQMLRGYLLAVEDYAADDVEAAVDTLIKGAAPGVNPNFLPPPATVGAECRRQLNLRLDSQQRSQLARPALPRPDVEHSPESRARIKAMVDAVASKASLPDAIRDKSSKARGEADTRWLLNRGDLVEHPGNPYPVSRTLLRQFEVGDPEAEADAA